MPWLKLRKGIEWELGECGEEDLVIGLGEFVCFVLSG